MVKVVNYVGLLATATLFALTACRAERPSSPAPAQENLRFGRLGHPLGTYLAIGGVRDTSGKTGPGSLLVDTVNGECLQPAVSIWVDELELPGAGRVELREYESGRFIGVTPEVAAATGRATQAGWQFQRYFIATSIESGAARMQE